MGDGGTILATGDGGRTWQAQESPTVAHLLSVQFPDQANGWAVGADGTILRIEAPDLSALVSATETEAIRQAAQAAAERYGMDFEVELARLEAIGTRLRAARDIRAQLAAGQPRVQASTQGEEGTLTEILLRRQTIEQWANRVGVVVLLMFLVAIFSTLYRYNLRMSAFYDARADALLLAWMEESDHTLAELVTIFGPENIDFAKARTPAEHAFDLAREGVRAAGRRRQGASPRQGSAAFHRPRHRRDGAWRGARLALSLDACRTARSSPRSRTGSWTPPLAIPRSSGCSRDSAAGSTRSGSL